MGSFLPGPGFINPLPGLPSLPQLPGFLPVTGPVQASPKSPYPDATIPGVGDIVLGLPGGGGATGGGIKLTSGNLGTSTVGFLSSPIGYLFGSSLLRLAFFILGFICIIGAIYLYKDTRFIVKVPYDAAKTTAKAGLEVAGAAAKAGGGAGG